jgi:hypothetical protein
MEGGELTLKAPIMKMPISTALFLRGSWTLNRRGMGMQMIIRSEERFRTAFVMRWFVAAEHCVDVGGMAQYWLKGRHQTPRYRTSMTTCSLC